MESEMHPIWYETAFALVTPAELDVDERLRLQLWDSDRFTADDDLGRIEVDLKALINGEGNETQQDGEGWKRTNRISNEEEEGDLPSAYCTIIINHAKVYMTRTKPKNARPFFNAGTEKFIADWRNTEVHVSVRDGRVHEDDALLGIVHFPLSEVFKERSQIHGFYPLAGGVGYGRIRISMVDAIKPVDLPDNFKHMKIKLTTSLGSAKIHSHDEAWQRKNKISLAVKDRYSSCFTIRFRVKGIAGSKTEAFSVIWLREIPDEEEQDIELPVWKGDFKQAVKSSIHELGEKIGTIKVQLTFWSGLGPKHTSWAIKNNDMRNVVQVLETAHDNLEESKAEKAAGVVDEDIDESAVMIATRLMTKKARTNTTMNESRRKRSKTRTLLHERNKTPRTAQWAFHKAETAEHKLAGIFKRHSRGVDIETEFHIVFIERPLTKNISCQIKMAAPEVPAILGKDLNEHDREAFQQGHDADTIISNDSDGKEKFNDDTEKGSSHHKYNSNE
ncbi:hypothetical protein MRB53_037270 [Persea americana]|nr:hypothetical protein MRB53_037270 [Persea americana]